MTRISAVTGWQDFSGKIRKRMPLYLNLLLVASECDQYSGICGFGHTENVVFVMLGIACMWFCVVVAFICDQQQEFRYMLLRIMLSNTSTWKSAESIVTASWRRRMPLLR